MMNEQKKIHAAHTKNNKELCLNATKRNIKKNIIFHIMFTTQHTYVHNFVNLYMLYMAILKLIRVCRVKCAMLLCIYSYLCVLYFNTEVV